jgi:hypothetical protein
MQIHVLFEGGPFDGVFRSVSGSGEVPKELRLAAEADCIPSGDVMVQIYQLVRTDPAPVRAQSVRYGVYRHAGERWSRQVLVDLWME